MNAIDALERIISETRSMGIGPYRKRLRALLTELQGSNSNWGEFLAARARCIDEFAADGKTDLEIARMLSMDGPVQVALIRARERPSEGD